MKTSILKSMWCVAIIFASALNVNLMAQEKFITDDVMTGELVTSKIIYRHDGSLQRHIKHDFTYDDQNRMIEKETFKWNSNTDEWMPYCKISLTYTSDQVIMDYGRWNKKAKAYNEAKERSVYELDGFSAPVSYQNHKWNDREGLWKIVENKTIHIANSLYAVNK